MEFDVCTLLPMYAYIYNRLHVSYADLKIEFNALSSAEIYLYITQLVDTNLVWYSYEQGGLVCCLENGLLSIDGARRRFESYCYAPVHAHEFTMFGKWATAGMVTMPTIWGNMYRTLDTIPNE